MTRSPCVLNSLLLLFLHIKCYLLVRDCTWTIVVNQFDRLGSSRHLFMMQTEIRKVAEIFKKMEDSAIDPEDKDSHYFGFPYFLKINLSCQIQDSALAIRTAYYTGLKPVVIVTFQEPVHSVRQKREQLQIKMKAAPYALEGDCTSEEVCLMCWFTPMPMMNGSVVTDILVETDGLGVSVEDKKFSINVNGFVKRDEKTGQIVYSIGKKLTDLRDFLTMKEESRPLWATHMQAPVVIVGSVSDAKVVLLSDTFFDDFFAIEVAIDSCWIGSLSCPQKNFSSSILDTISTESTLFIRQNQLVYYFTGRYPALYMESPGSALWTRILNNVCVRNLNPVHFSKNHTEYVIALGGGWQEGEFFLIYVKDGIVTASDSLKSNNGTVCAFLQARECFILHVVFLTEENRFVLLVKVGEDFHIVSYSPAEEKFRPLYLLPIFIPKASDKGFVMLMGTEQYSKKLLDARGLAYNPYSKMLYVWGNFVFQSHDLENYIYLSDFPSTSMIKYFVQSYQGQFTCVTDNEEIWVSIEGSASFLKVFPSESWNLYRDLQILAKSPQYGVREARITVFYEQDELHELLYLEDKDGNKRVIKRNIPLDSLLMHHQLMAFPYMQISHEGKEYIRFTHNCPFAVMRIVDLPHPQLFTRMEHYHAEPPDVMDPAGLHDRTSLAVYQGLIFQLLRLHSAYNRPYADPVHDPTWRWWKNKKEDADYYFYVAANRNSSGGIYVNMNNYEKLYKLRPNNDLPPRIYLDKNDSFTFFVFLSIRTTKQSLGETAEENSLRSVWVTIILSHPKYFAVKMARHELISRGSVLYEVKVSDAGLFPNQDLSGKNLLRGSIILKVAHSTLHCYHHTAKGPKLQGNRMMAVNIGCPPGKRLAFDITGTLKYTTKKNKRYFDCVHPDPEMPCFFFSDVIYPFFLIQDMVTGQSGPFHGSYIFTVIGGGPFSEKRIRYFSKKEILRYNSVHGSKTNSLIWLREDNLDNETDSDGFHILSENRSGIMFVCQKNSACYDIVPKDMTAPHYFFVVKVSNRGVDQSTYCDYALEFVIHVHGLRLSPTRAIYLMKDLALPSHLRYPVKVPCLSLSAAHRGHSSQKATRQPTPQITKGKTVNAGQELRASLSTAKGTHARHGIFVHVSSSTRPRRLASSTTCDWYLFVLELHCS